MNYYAIGDTMYVVAHHGVQGMHWGVRRFQPYGQGGYNRKDGKTGKVVGDAKDLQKSYNKLNRKRTTITVASGVAAGGLTVGAVAAGTAGTIATGFVTPAILSMYSTALTTTLPIAAGRSKVEKLLKESPIANDKITISEGTKLARTSQKESGDAGRLYVRLNNSKRDNFYYDKEWPNRLRQISGDPNQKIYRNTYQVKTTLVAPSKEERIKIAEAMINADKKVKTEFGKAYALQQVRIQTGKLGAKTLKEIENEYDMPSTKKRIKELAKDYEAYAVGNGKKKIDFRENDNRKFNSFVATIPTSSKLMNSYIKELKKNGYNAVFDDNSRAVADTPFIVFDSKYIEQVSSKELKKGT